MTRGPTTTPATISPEERERLILRRRELISKLIDGLYIDKNQEPPEAGVLTAMVARWDRHLTRNRVPSRLLQKVYDRAVDMYTNEAPFSVFDLLEAWRRIQAEAAAQVPEKPPCDLEHLDEEEKLVELVLTHSGQEVKLPCPNCRPSAFDFKRKEIEVNAEKKSGSDQGTDPGTVAAE